MSSILTVAIESILKKQPSGTVSVAASNISYFSIQLREPGCRRINASRSPMSKNSLYKKSITQKIRRP